MDEKLEAFVARTEATFKRLNRETAELKTHNMLVVVLSLLVLSYALFLLYAEEVPRV